MRHRFLLLSAAIVAGVPAIGSAPAQAKRYMEVADAQALSFPGSELTPQFFNLDTKQVSAIINDARAPVLNHEVRVWRVSTGGWFFLDQVLGIDDRITYAVALDAEGAVKHVEILECQEGYESVRDAAWLIGFVGARHNRDIEVDAISGSTLSSEHIKAGVKRLLSTYALFLRSSTG